MEQNKKLVNVKNSVILVALVFLISFGIKQIHAQTEATTTIDESTPILNIEPNEPIKVIIIDTRSEEEKIIEYENQYFRENGTYKQLFDNGDGYFVSVKTEKKSSSYELRKRKTTYELKNTKITEKKEIPYDIIFSKTNEN